MEQSLIVLIEQNIQNGILDLEHWKANNTKENIFKMIYFQLYWQLRSIMRMAT